MNFSLKQTNIIKGLLILIMVFHHLFSVQMNYFLSFFNGKEVPELLNTIALYGKICVGGFCFLSAYGIAKKIMEAETPLKSIIVTRLVKLYLAIWPVYVFGVLGTLLFGNKPLSSIYISPKTQKFSWILPVIDVLGLGDLFDTPMLNAQWWYTWVAIYVLLITPIIFSFLKKHSYLGAFALLALSYIADINSLCYLATTGLGILCAKEDLLVKIKEKICAKTSNRIIGYVGIILLNIAVYELYTVTSVFHIMPFSTLACLLFCYVILADIPGVSHALGFLGKHSANIYYIHGFLYLYWFTYTIYSLENKLLIYIVVLVSSLVISIVLEMFKKLILYKKLEQWLIGLFAK